MQATSRIQINEARIKELSDAAVKSLEQTAERLKKDVKNAQVIPRDKGNLQGESFFVDTSHCKEGTATLVHATPYARRLYFHPEYNFQKDENPNAKGRWFEDWLKGGVKEDFCQKTFDELYRRNAGL